MTVKELIAILKFHDPNTTVVVGGLDEEGFADLSRIEIVRVVRRKSPSAAETFGEYQSALANDKEFVTTLLIDHN